MDYTEQARALKPVAWWKCPKCGWLKEPAGREGAR